MEGNKRRLHLGRGSFLSAHKAYRQELLGNLSIGEKGKTPVRNVDKIVSSLLSGPFYCSNDAAAKHVAHNCVFQSPLPRAHPTVTHREQTRLDDTSRSISSPLPTPLPPRPRPSPLLVPQGLVHHPGVPHGQLGEDTLIGISVSRDQGATI